jgi:hypothetical protein
MSNDDLKVSLEELRALLVLGIVGTLFTMAQLSPNHVFAFGITFRWIADTLLISWGGYLFLAVVGISTDCVRKEFALACRDIAKFLFVFGIALGLAVAITILAGGMLEPTLTQYGIKVGLREAGWVLIVMTFAFAYVVARPELLSRRPRMN